jgi:hypothetical protein
MTTSVSVSCNGPNYQATVVKSAEGLADETTVIPGGSSGSFNVGNDQTLTITEQYLPDGQKAAA